MITNNEDINTYSSYNKIYIPNSFINNAYRYYFNGDYVIIVKNSGCYQQYNTTYCDCNYYNYKNNVISEQSSCNAYPNNYQIPYSLISNDINDSTYIRDRFIGDKSILFGIVIIAIIFTILLTKEIRY